MNSEQLTMLMDALQIGDASQERLRLALSLHVDEIQIVLPVASEWAALLVDSKSATLVERSGDSDFKIQTVLNESVESIQTDWFGDNPIECKIQFAPSRFSRMRASYDFDVHLSVPRQDAELLRRAIRLLLGT